MKDTAVQSATDRTFATPELMEHILTFLPAQLLPVNHFEDPRSVRVHGNARVLKHLLRCSEVNRTWFSCIRKESSRCRRALYLQPDLKSHRLWVDNTSDEIEQARKGEKRGPSLHAPSLNPIIQSFFPAYHFRFWRLSLETTGNRYCAYLILRREALADWPRRRETGCGKAVSDMLLSQPPCQQLEAIIWEERDETKDYVGRTRSLRDPILRDERGLTLGAVHDAAARMFAEHSDVMAIKFMTN